MVVVQVPNLTVQDYIIALKICDDVLTGLKTDCLWFAVLLEYILMMTISGETISTVSINLASQETYLAANNFNCDFTCAPR